MTNTFAPFATTHSLNNALLSIRRLVRYARILGVRRALNKAAARMRIRIPRIRIWQPKSPTVAVIGCGQFAFSTIGFFVESRAKLIMCFDTDTEAADSLATHYGMTVASCVDDLFNSKPDVIYIASNHASHTDYAIRAMRSGCGRVYVEKPICVSTTQLNELELCRQQSSSKLFVGYNRPFAPAIKTILNEIKNEADSQFTVNCFVSGHKLDSDHWYRNPEEGTRVCGNLGHWIDLSIHLFAAVNRSASEFRINITYSSQTEPDDNLNVCLSTENGDLISLTLTSRCEPFEGINESINIHYGNLIAKIDDFRELQLWVGAKRIRRRYFPKDVGHRNSVLQPMSDSSSRDWREVVTSTRLMLQIAEMVKTRQETSAFQLTEEECNK